MKGQQPGFGLALLLLTACGSRFRGRFSCDSLWGEFTAYRTTPPESLVFHRRREAQGR